VENQHLYQPDISHVVHIHIDNRDFGGSVDSHPVPPLQGEEQRCGIHHWH